jgi:hypothetical protein
VQEFNQIAGLIFAQLYEAFPVAEDINKARLAQAMGADGTDWPAHVLPSGRTLNEMVAHTIGWLNREGFISAYGSHPAERVVLTTKGLAAMNVTPAELKRSVGTELREAAGKGGSMNLSAVGDLIGGALGGFTKSLGNG